ncbi:MAG: ferrochelatase [Desertimonas sp.]
MSTGVVVMAYGTPRAPGEILAYYTDIRRGRPPEPEQLADLIRRYDAIGGLSPLARITNAQRDTLQATLDRRAPGQYQVEVGLKHVMPRIADAVGTLIGRGADEVVGLVLAPHYSAMSVGHYHEQAGEAATAQGVAYRPIDSWATLPAYVEFLAADLRHRLDALPAGTRAVFTAHSLPRRILDHGDPYPDELRSTATAVAAAAGLAAERWQLGWQSAGRTPEPWLGPDILEIIDTAAADGQTPGMLVCPCGFVADHLEILYDLDIEARQRAERHGLAFDRTTSLNTEPTVFEALAELVETAAVGS